MKEPIFVVGKLVAEPLEAEDAAALRELFASCDGTEDLACGLPAGSADDPRHLGAHAQAEPFSIGVFEGEDTAGILDIFRESPAPGVWTIGLLMVETGKRGDRLGHEVLDAFAAWARESGACRLRVGAPPQGEAFWYEAGFEPASLENDEDAREEGLVVLERAL
jgi:hypothetical protein